MDFGWRILDWGLQKTEDRRQMTDVGSQNTELGIRKPKCGLRPIGVCAPAGSRKKSEEQELVSDLIVKSSW